MNPFLLAAALPVALIAIAAANTALANGLPAPTRTVYKCQDGQKTYYSDAPCVGATKVDVTPTRGLDKSSGQQRQGADVQRERQREQIADAIRPLTGMDAQQLAQFGRRSKLTPEAQKECRRLDAALPQAEQAERAARSSSERQVAQQTLFKLRQLFHELRCE